MPALTVLVFDGAGTNGLPPEDPRSILTPVIERLRWRTGCAVHRPPWAASLMGVGGNTPWPVASHKAVIAAAEYMHATEGRFILLGFSAGCRPARELLEQHPELHDRIAACGLMGDPWQPAHRNQSGVPNPPGVGIMGGRDTALPKKTFYSAAPGDPICRSAWDSLLRWITPASDVLPGQFLIAFVDKARWGRLQLVPFLGLPIHQWALGLGPRIRRSVEEARGYLTDGRHTRGYTEPFRTSDGRTDSLAHRLADTLAWKARQG